MTDWFSQPLLPSLQPQSLNKDIAKGMKIELTKKGVTNSKKQIPGKKLLVGISEGTVLAKPMPRVGANT